MDKYLGGCQEALNHFGKDDVNCCGSCHDNEEYLGYQLCPVQAKDKGGYFEVCCKVSVVLTETENKLKEMAEI